MEHLNLTVKLPKLVWIICFLEALNNVTAFYPQKLLLQIFEAFFI